MASYWKSIPIYRCKYCGCNLQDTVAARKHHEAGKKHKENVEKFMLEMSKNNHEKRVAADELQDTLQKIEEAALIAEGLPTKRQKTGPQTVPGPSMSDAPTLTIHPKGTTVEQKYRGKQTGVLYTKDDFNKDHEWEKWNQARLKKLEMEHKAEKRKAQATADALPTPQDDDWRDVAPSKTGTSTGFGAWQTVTVTPVEQQQPQQPQSSSSSTVEVHVQEAAVAGLSDSDEELVGKQHSQALHDDPEQRASKDKVFKSLKFDFGLKEQPKEEAPRFEFKLKTADVKYEDRAARQARVLQNATLMGQTVGSLAGYIRKEKQESGQVKKEESKPKIVVPAIAHAPEQAPVAFKKNSNRAGKRQFRRKGGDDSD